MSTYYVATTGDDSNPGSSAAPFAKIDKASRVAATGDTIHIAGGTYYEKVAPQVDGVTYTGDRGPNGEWLTIIDPSNPVPQNWTQAPEVGPNVWQIKLQYQPGIFTYNGQCIECVGQKLMALPPNSPLPEAFPVGFTVPPNIGPGLALLAQANPSQPLFESGGTLKYPVNFWDGPYALAAYDPSTELSGPGSGTTYIRFRDNLDPRTLTLRAASGSPGGAPWTYGIDNYGMSNMTITNLAIQGAYAGIRLSKGHNNTVKHCRIQHGLHRIYVQDNPGSTTTHDNEISFNTFTLNMYGYASPGAYSVDKASATDDLALKEWFYRFLKYIVGDKNTADIGIKIGYCGKNNLIHNNIFQYGAEGVFTYLCDNTQIYANIFQHMSDCGVLASDSATDDPNSLHGAHPSGETVQGNTFTDVAQFIRYDRIDLALDGVTTNFHLFLYNTGANGPNAGEIVQFHMHGPDLVDPSKTIPSTVGKFALTMTGNKFGSTYTVFNFSGYTFNRKGIPAVTIASNSFLSPYTIRYGGNDENQFVNEPTMVGSFVNNRLVNNMADDSMADDNMGKPPKWYGIGNYIQPYPPLY